MIDQTLELGNYTSLIYIVSNNINTVKLDVVNSVFCRSSESGKQWFQSDPGWLLEIEKHKAEAERSKGQVEALKETAERYREELREKDISLSRYSFTYVFTQ